MQEQQQIQSLWRKCKIPVNKRGQEEWQMFYHKARLMHFKIHECRCTSTGNENQSVQPLSPEEKRTILNTTFSARGNSQKKNEDPQERI